MNDDFFPEIAVAGLGRCGLTMTAQMLYVAGVDVAGEPPGFEPTASDVVGNAEAIKMVDPINTGWAQTLPDPGHLRWVWLARDARQQAKSMAKLLKAQGKNAPPKRLRETIRPDTKKHLRLIDRRDEEILKLRYEDAVARTENFVDRLIGFLGRDLDRDKMVAVVDERDATSREDLTKELNMIRET